MTWTSTTSIDARARSLSSPGPVRHIGLAVLIALVGLMVAPARSLAQPGTGWELSGTTYPSNLVKGVNQLDTVTVEAATFDIAVEGEATKALPKSSSAAAVKAALEELANVGAGNVVVTRKAEGAFSIELVGLLGGMKGPELSGEGASIEVTRRGAASGMVQLDVLNVGAAASSGTVEVVDTLPAGLEAKEAGAIRPAGIGENGSERWGVAPLLGTGRWDCTGNGPGAAPKVAGAKVVTCVNGEEMSFVQGGAGPPAGKGPNPQPQIGITVEGVGPEGEMTNRATISGGGATTSTTTENNLVVGPTPKREGITGWDAWASNEDGTVDEQAGSHPYSFTTVFHLATQVAEGTEQEEGSISGGEPRNIEVRLPAGLVGDLSTTPQCTQAELEFEESGYCPAASEVGVLSARTLAFGLQLAHPVFNMVPAPGQPAELGFKLNGVTVLIGFTVRTGGDNGITAHINNLPQREIVESIFTIWGVPGEKSHDPWRTGHEGGCSQEQLENSPYEGSEESYCSAPQHPLLNPVLRMPTSCGTPQTFEIHELDTWSNPNATFAPLTAESHNSAGTPQGYTGCQSLAFGPSFEIAPETAQADTATGLSVIVAPALVGFKEPGALSDSDLKASTVTLPEGFVANPEQAAGLEFCTDAEAALEPLANGEENDGPAQCPGASKIGTAVVRSPLIEGAVEKQLEGGIYVLPSNPPELKLLVAAKADGVNLKLVGVSRLNETTGQITTTFANSPQSPFSVFKLNFEGGSNSSLVSPSECKSYSATAAFTAWSEPEGNPFLDNASFNIAEGAGGSACPETIPFTPTLAAGSGSTQAGGFTSLTALIQRKDGQQRIGSTRLSLPIGLSAMIANVPLCAEPAAALGTCGATSQIGHASVTAGPGATPLTIPQPGQPEVPIYLTGPYDGAPFGLSIVTPLIAGPFNLGTIVTRAKIEVDPMTAQVSVVTDPLPQYVKGVPTDIRSVSATIDRSDFSLNPTNCSALAFGGSVTGAAPPGVSAAPITAGVGSRFEVGSCKELTFKPTVGVSVTGHSSRADGVGLSFTISYPKGALGKEAWFRGTKFMFPKQLPARQSTLRLACLAKVFEVNPAACPKASVAGHAKVHTPVLPVPLEGDVYLVSHGGEKFPDAVMVLHGDNITIDLTGHTLINSKTGITSVNFSSTPDVPFERIEVALPAGPFSEFGAYLPASAKSSLCGQKLTMPTQLIAQNGLEISQSTKVAVTGCKKAKKAKKKKSKKG